MPLNYHASISKSYDSVFTKISKFCSKALSSLALEFSDKSTEFETVYVNSNKLIFK
jgi:NO-binding membrane sensor protein with MHYT domain